MSRIGNMPVQLPSGVECALSEASLRIKGPKGTLELALDDSVRVEQQGSELRFQPADADDAHCRAMVGTMRSLAANMVVGVSEGFERRLQLSGVGYRANLQGKALSLSLGYSHPKEYKLPEQIEVKVEKQTTIILSGIDKQRLGQVAAEIRALRPPEPYKGKGVSYEGEYIVRKEAKKK